MKVKLIPEGTIVDAYLPISSLERLLIKYPDPLPKGKDRWESRSKGSYEIVEE